jgi:site-specific DNA-methyltransferase (adenine-specific)
MGKVKLNTIYHLDCREGLQQLKANSIDCCITSPPYWGLRDYGLEPLTWDGDLNCDHTFDTIVKTIESSKNKDFNERCGGSSGQRKQEASQQTTIESGFCSKCGAWQGSLGNEPTPDLYIQHLSAIFSETYRVLKSTGTCWVNLGDSYGSGKGTRTDDNPKQMHQLKRDSIKGFEKSLCLIPFRFAIAMQEHGWIIRNVLIWHKPNAMPSSVKDRFTVDNQILSKVIEGVDLLDQSMAILNPLDILDEDAPL